MKTTTRISINVKPAVRRIVSPDISTSSAIENSCVGGITIPAGLGAGKPRADHRISWLIWKIGNRIDSTMKVTIPPMKTIITGSRSVVNVAIVLSTSLS